MMTTVVIASCHATGDRNRLRVREAVRKPPVPAARVAQVVRVTQKVKRAGVTTMRAIFLAGVVAIYYGLWNLHFGPLDWRGFAGFALLCLAFNLLFAHIASSIENTSYVAGRCF
jgi:hypothetical protein